MLKSPAYCLRAFTASNLTHPGVRCFSVTSTSLAKQAPKFQGGKKKIKIGFKKSDNQAAKPKRGGMTHLKFRDAIRELNFEKLATRIEDLNIQELTHTLVESEEPCVVKYNERTEQSLKQLNSFKKYQHHELFSKPISLVSTNTAALYKKHLSTLEKPTRENRVCLIGEKGVGKSVLLTQAQALGLSKHQNVFLLHLDFPEKIVEGSSDYIFNKRIEKYQQPMFTKRWIKKIRDSNEDVLKQMPLSKDVSFVTKKTEYKLKKNENTLFDYLLQNHEFGKFGPSSAFKFFIDELMFHSKNIPVLVTVDNFNALTSKTLTAYRHPDFRSIHFTDFEMGDFILQLASGDISFSRGCVILAESKDLGYSHTLPVGLKLEEYDPYYKNQDCDYEVANKLLSNGGISVFNVKNLNKLETKTLMNFWDVSGVLQVKSYPIKEDYGEATPVSPADEESLDNDSKETEVALDTIFQRNFVVTSGNPGSLLKTTILSY